MNIKVTNPNFSIVVPSKCDSHCSFCFGSDKKIKKIGRIKYLKNLIDTLDNLPPYFTQISITGGEPTLCPLLEDILHSIDKDRFPKLVLTTSATKNGNLLGTRFIDKVDHINISRHCMDDIENSKVFGNDEIPDKNELKQLIKELNMAGIDVSLNCVLTEDTIKIRDYINFAKHVGATACQFRKNQTPKSNLEPTKYELLFSEYKVIYRNECPVCRSETQYIDGMKVTWRASLYEPSNEMDGIYELIFQSDGRVTSDWAGENEIKVNIAKAVGGSDLFDDETLSDDILADDGVNIKLMSGCGSGTEPTRIYNTTNKRGSGRLVSCGNIVLPKELSRKIITPHAETYGVVGCGISRGC